MRPPGSNSLRQSGQGGPHVDRETRPDFAVRGGAPRHCEIATTLVGLHNAARTRRLIDCFNDVLIRHPSAGQRDSANCREGEGINRQSAATIFGVRGNLARVDGRAPVFGTRHCRGGGFRPGYVARGRSPTTRIPEGVGLSVTASRLAEKGARRANCTRLRPIQV
jgi:hypothetical protein